MHGVIGRYAPPERPERGMSGFAAVLCIAIVGGLALIALQQRLYARHTEPASPKPAPKAVLPSPARLRHRSERLA